MPLLKEHGNLKINNVLNWYDPVGWVREAFKIRTRIVHAQWWSWPLAPVYLTILVIAKMRGKRVVLTIHNVKPHERHFLKKYLSMTFLLADCYIVHTAKNREELREFVKSKAVHVIPHPVIRVPKQGMVKSKARRYLGLDAEDKVLLHFGHIRDYKGLDVALRALAAMEEKRIKLVIAGQCWEDWRKYQEIIDAYCLGARVIVKKGLIPEEDIEALFTASDLVLLPYKYFSAQSGVGALAVNFNIPLVVSDTGGLTDYVLDERCIVGVNDPAGLAAKIRDILSDKTLYEKLVEDIRTLRERFSPERVSQETRNIYARLAGPAGNAGNEPSFYEKVINRFGIQSEAQKKAADEEARRAEWVQMERQKHRARLEKNAEAIRELDKLYDKERAAARRANSQVMNKARQVRQDVRRERKETLKGMRQAGKSFFRGESGRSCSRGEAHWDDGYDDEEMGLGDEDNWTGTYDGAGYDGTPLNECEDRQMIQYDMPELPTMPDFSNLFGGGDGASPLQRLQEIFNMKLSQ